MCWGDAATLVVIRAARTSLAAGSSADGSDPCSQTAGSNAACSMLADGSPIGAGSSAAGCTLAAKFSIAADAIADDARYYCSLMFGKEYCLCRTC